MSLFPSHSLSLQLLIVVSLSLSLPAWIKHFWVLSTQRTSNGLAFTEMLELLLYAEVLLSQRLCMEIRRYQQGGGKKWNADKWLWCFSVPKQHCHFGTLCDLCCSPPCEDMNAAPSLVLPLIWEPKPISSVATFGRVMIDISILVMKLLYSLIWIVMTCLTSNDKDVTLAKQCM